MPADQKHLFPWMTAPEARELVKILTDGGANIRFVGGCVRDSILGRTVSDIDVATDALPERVIELINQAGYQTVPVGLEHGTVLAVIGTATFEITTLRHDVETDGRHATVAFTDDWVADAARRDLTINALSVEPNGTLHDPFQGLADLTAGRVRFVGNAQARITEDVLRLLRYYRFFAHYGKPPADSEARTACRQHASSLPRLSGERVHAELFKLLSAPDPVPAVRMMVDDGVFAHLFEAEVDVASLSKLIALETGRLDGVRDPLRRVAALIQPPAEGFKKITAALRLSNAENDYLEQMRTNAGLVQAATPPQKLNEILYRFGAPTVQDLIALSWARNAGGDEGWSRQLERVQAWSPVTFPLGGHDVIACGIESGPKVGKLLSDAEAWWIAAEFQPDRAACLAYLRELIAAG